MQGPRPRQFLAVLILNYLFVGGDVLTCLDTADANDDSLIDISDAILELFSLFGGSGPLPQPFPACGTDPTADDLGCAAFSGCP